MNQRMKTQDESDTESAPEEGAPPFFRTWKGMYTAIIAELVILIVLFRIVTVVFD